MTGGLAKPHASTHPHTHMYPYTQSSKSKHIVLKKLRKLSINARFEKKKTMKKNIGQLQKIRDLRDH